MAKANPPIEDHHVIRRNIAIPTGTVDGELMALDPEAGDVFGLDPVGTAIWEAIGEGARFDTIIERLCATHDVAPDTCRTDTRAFIAELAAANLVSVERS